MRYRKVVEIVGSFIIGILGGKNADATPDRHVRLSARDAVQVNIPMVGAENEDVISVIDLSEIKEIRGNDFSVSQIVEMWQKALQKQGMPADSGFNNKDILDLLKLSREDHSLRSVCAQIPNYRFSAEDLIFMKPDEQACIIAEKSKEYCVGTKGSCYHAVKGSIMSAVPFAYLGGRNAYDARNYLSKSPNHVEVPIRYTDTDKIADGATVVFEKGNTASGHTYISYRSSEKCYYDADDEKIEYQKSKERSDHEQKANLSGKRGTSGQRYGRPYAYFTSGTEVGLPTFLNITIQYASKYSEDKILKPRDVLKAFENLKAESYNQIENKANQAKEMYQSFEDATRNEGGYWIPKKVYVSKTRRTARKTNVRTGNSRT